MNYVGLDRRFVAAIIDYIITLLIGFIIVLVAPGMPNWVGLIFNLAYCVGFWTWRGQTPGKMVMRIKIVKTDGSPIGIVGAILRWVGYFVSTIILLIGYIMIAWDSKKQGLHDKIAGTVVIKVAD